MTESRALSPEEMNALGRTVIAAGDLVQAAEIFQLLCDAELAEPSALLALALANHSVGRLKDALEWAGRSVARDPGNPTAFQLLAHVLIEVGAFAAGADAAREAIRLGPELSTAHAQLGRCLHRLGRLDEAVIALEAALERTPKDASARLDLGNVYQDLGAWAQAEIEFGRAAQDDPSSAKPFYNLGNLLQLMGRRLEALAAYDRALAISPDDAATRVNLGLLQLTLEDFEQGWSNFEWRWSAPSERPFVRDCDSPIWRGEQGLDGKRILIQSEQGLGDTLQFIRYAEPLASRGAKVVVDVPASLRALLATAAGVDGVVSGGDPLPRVDFRCPMMSLPSALGIPSPLPSPAGGYLRVAEAAAQRWESRLPNSGRLRVGLAHAGNAKHTNDRNRSIDLGLVLKHLPTGAHYFILPTELRDDDEHQIASRDDVDWLGPEFNDLMETGAAMMRLDLIVSVDTAIAHLGGALGRPTHVLLPFFPDWRWGFERRDCLWYPTVALHRQRRHQDWTTPLQDVSAVIRARLDQS